jgi:hypothetical protein
MSVPEAAARIWEPVGEPPFKFTAAAHDPVRDVPVDVDVVRHSLNVQVFSRPSVGNETALDGLTNWQLGLCGFRRAITSTTSRLSMPCTSLMWWAWL